MFDVKGKYTNATVLSDLCDQYSIGIITKFVNSEMFSNSKIRIMPDVHISGNSLVGTTISLDKEFDRICPDIIGTDIGCGVTAVNIGKIDSFNLKEIDEFIKEQNNFKKFDISKYIQNLKIIEKLNYFDVIRTTSSLGGGNHFIEIDKSNDEYWLVIHTGSRVLGKELANTYISKSKLEKGDLLKSISGSLLSDYLSDLKLVQLYAKENRMSIINSICSAFSFNQLDVIDSFHNYIDIDNLIIRKGAIKADNSEKLIIPINMRDGSIIGQGLGNLEWNKSAPHGAGRLLSRSSAKLELSQELFKKSMTDVFSTTIDNKISESPGAYKSLDYIKKSIIDSVEIKDHITPIYVFKS